MADSALKLQIITALDQAGLKATENQVRQLETQLKNSGSSGSQSMGKINNELTKMPGKFGKLAGQLGQVGTLLGSVYAAWKTLETGVKIGNGVFKQFGDGASYSLESVKNGFSSLWDTAWNGMEKFFTGTNKVEAAQQANALAAQVNEDAIKRATEAAEKHADAVGRIRSEHDKNIAKINQETAAYIAQAQAVAGLKSAGTNANVILMESQKYSAQQKYIDEGNLEAAEQIGKAYDVMIAKEKQVGVQKQNNFNIAKQEKDLEGKTSQLMQTMTTTDKSLAKMNELAVELEKARTIKGYAGTRQTLAWQKAYDKAAEQYESSLLNEDKLKNEILTGANNLQALKINAAASNEQSFQSLRSAYNNYNMFEEQYGNIANIEFGKSIMDNLTLDSDKSYRQLERIARAVEEQTSIEDVMRALKMR